MGEYSEGKATRNRALAVYKSRALRSVNKRRGPGIRGRSMRSAPHHDPNSLSPPGRQPRCVRTPHPRPADLSTTRTRLPRAVPFPGILGPARQHPRTLRGHAFILRPIVSSSSRSREHSRSTSPLSPTRRSHLAAPSPPQSNNRTRSAEIPDGPSIRGTTPQDHLSRFINGAPHPLNPSLPSQASPRS